MPGVECTAGQSTGAKLHTPQASVEKGVGGVRWMFTSKILLIRKILQEPNA